MLRQIVDAPLYVRNTIIHRDLKISTIKEKLIHETEKMYRIAINHENLLLKDIASYNPRDVPKHKRSKVTLT